MPNRAATFAITALLCAVAFTQAHSLPVSLEKYWTARIEQLMSVLCNVDASASEQSAPSNTGCTPCPSSDSAKNCCLSKEERREECWRNVINRLQLDDDAREGVYDAIREKRTRNKSLGKRTPQKRQRNTFLGKRGDESDNASELDEADFESIEKRPRNMSLGKRGASGPRNSFLGKRARNTSLGKRAGFDGGDFDDQNESDVALSDYTDGSVVSQQRFDDKRGRNTFLG